MSRESIASALLILLPLALTALAALAAWGTRAITRLIKDRRVALALEVIANGAAAIVADLAQHVVADLKDPSKPGDWTHVAAATVRVRAVERVKQLYPQAVALAAEALANPERINDLLGTVVERAVVDLKAKAPSKAVEAIGPVIGREAVVPEVAAQLADEVVPRDGQRGSISLRALLAVALLSLVALAASCIPARRFVLDHTDGVPARVACTPRTQACVVTDAGVYLPVVYSDECRPWPTLSLRADGVQRTCAPGEGCAVDGDSGIASCTAADGGVR
ncbi:MAG: hypothetical protein EPO40_16530 [Myxococcaceae bacterium]|nr:MAG: hypothetical protein EPO40_16530 [Myxococcaceae bacterium]